MEIVNTINTEELQFLIMKNMEKYNMNRYEAKEMIAQNYQVAQEV